MGVLICKMIVSFLKKVINIINTQNEEEFLLIYEAHEILRQNTYKKSRVKPPVNNQEKENQTNNKGKDIRQEFYR